jgi:16S rRNA (cytosine1402-N4)-methyltransferase
MHINDEFGQLRAGMRAAFKLLAPGGRMGIITWKHSECAVVMDFLRSKELAGEEFPLRAWWQAERADEPLKRAAGLRRGDARRPGVEELRVNARARSAVLHVLHKEEGVRVREVEKRVHTALGWGRLRAGEDNEAAT